MNALSGEVAVAPFYQYAQGTSSSATITTVETVTDTITVALVSGQAYEVEYNGLVQSSVAADVALFNLKEDSLSGTRMCDGRVTCSTAGAGKTFLAHLRAVYTAIATGNKTFVVTLVRDSGSGNLTRAAASSDPALLSVERKGS